MELKQLQFFMRTAELEHMTKASSELMVSQPYLSKKLSDLEEELGAPLFDHIGRGIVVNPCGKAFYRRVVNIFNEIEDGKKEIQNINLSHHARITVATNCGQYMPGLLEQITLNNPGIIIRQLSAQKRDIIRMIKNGEANFALCSPPLDEDSDLETIELHYEQAVVICPKGHWIRTHKSISFDKIKNEAFITVSQGYGARDALDAYFHDLGMSPRILIETTDTSSVFRYVEKGLGIAAVPLSTVLQENEFKDCYSVLEHNAGGRIALTWRKNQFLNEAEKMFIETSKEYYKNLHENTMSSRPY